MFDEFHNAVPGNKNYYLVNGEFAGVADSIPKYLGIVNWNHSNKAKQSLSFFEDKGFKQITAPYYDTDEQHIRRSKNNAGSINKFKGMMYTTWTKNYSYLKHFGYLAWNHSPFIYHRPINDIPDSKILNLEYKVSKGTYDSSEINSFGFYYRTTPDALFSAVDLKSSLNPSGNGNYQLQLGPEVSSLQYYFEAENSDGWKTKVPFGDSIYYTINKSVNSIDGDTKPSIVNTSVSILEPNIIKVYDIPKNLDGFTIKIFDLLGRTLDFNYEIAETAMDFHIKIHLNNATGRGIYFLFLINSKRVYYSTVLLL